MIFFQYKSRAKELGMTPEDYGRSVLNLVNTNTPEKRAAIAVQQYSPPCRTLFEVNIEEELLGYDSGKESNPSDDEQLVEPPTKL